MIPSNLYKNDQAFTAIMTANGFAPPHVATPETIRPGQYVLATNLDTLVNSHPNAIVKLVFVKLVWVPEPVQAEQTFCMTMKELQAYDADERHATPRHVIVERVI